MDKTIYKCGAPGCLAEFKLPAINMLTNAACCPACGAPDYDKVEPGCTCGDKVERTSFSGPLLAAYKRIKEIQLKHGYNCGRVAIAELSTVRNLLKRAIDGAALKQDKTRIENTIDKYLEAVGPVPMDITDIDLLR